MHLNPNDLHKYKNTAKMLGAKPLQALNFADACLTLMGCINPSIKAKSRNTILSTELYGITFENWLKDKCKSLPLSEETEQKFMSIDEAKDNFSLGLVEQYLKELINKQYHQTAN